MPKAEDRVVEPCAFSFAVLDKDARATGRISPNELGISGDNIFLHTMQVKNRKEDMLLPYNLPPLHCHVSLAGEPKHISVVAVISIPSHQTTLLRVALLFRSRT